MTVLAYPAEPAEPRDDADRSKRPSALLPVYVAAVLAIGGTLVVAAGLRLAQLGGSTGWSELVFWLALSLAAECFWLETPTGRGMISMSPAINFASLFVLPLEGVLCVSVASVWLADLLLHRRSAARASFNASQTGLSLSACLLLLYGASGGTPQGIGILFGPPYLILGLPIVFLVVNTGLVSEAIALESGDSLWKAWRSNYGFAYQVLSTIGLFTVALALAGTYESVGFVGTLLFLSVLWLARDAYRRHVERSHGATARP